MRVIYLHGFASSPASRKAQFFAEQLRAEGCRVDIPDLAQGDFTHLTLSGQFRELEKVQGGEPVAMIGSSMGGYLAALFAAKHPEVTKVVLLAPAFDLHDLWIKELGYEKLKNWRENGPISVFHYGEGREMPLAFDLMEDAARFEAFPDFHQPGLIFHGVDDPVVPIAQSRRFAQSHGNVCLREMQSGHELTNVLEQMWHGTKTFLLADG